MMKRSRRTSRNMELQPGLFDSIGEFAPQPASDAGEMMAGFVADAVRHLREKAAKDAEDDSLAMDNGTRAGTDRLMFVSLGSGSSGNCAYLGTRSSGVLIDAGVDRDFVIAELKRNGVDYVSAVSGILLTHDHGDHVRFAYPLLRRYPDKFLWTTPKTMTGILRRHNISRRIKDYHKPIYKEFEFNAGPLSVTPFDTSHDGTDNVGFAIRYGSEVFVVATDMGCVTDRALHYMRQATALMVESNYDARMLAEGRYPQYLQARIRGERGHMDNEETSRRLAEVWTPAMHHVFLCHLSHDNNTPELALAAARRGLEQAGATVVTEASAGYEALRHSVHLAALPRFEASRLVIF